MSMPPLPPEVTDALALYFDNQATPEVCQVIQDWLEQDPANAQVFAEFGYVERMIYAAQKTEDASAVFAMLAEMEAAAETEIVELKLKPTKTDIRAASVDPGVLSASDLVAVGGYVLRKALTSKPAILAYAAAVALFAALLFFDWGAGEQDTSQPIAEQPQDEPAQTPEAIYVATLSRQDKATWAQGLIDTNTRLEAGQRLTLIKGSAEITTHQGAIAVLQAPVTVELLDHNNALRLHTGKLVGICETPSSKGFLVRTPHTDVIDLGTRFAVETSDAGLTEVHVYQGEVEVVRPDNNAPNQLVRQRLVKGQAVQAALGQPAFTEISPAFHRFATGLGFHQLGGTAASIHRGAKTDNEWQLIALDGERLETPVPLSITKPVGASAITPNVPAVARWIGIRDTDAYQGDQDAVYTIQTNIMVPNHIDLDTAVLVIDFHADDRLEEIHFNARPYPGWKQVEQTKNGKGTASIPLRDILVKHGVNGVNLKIRNIAATELFLHLAWRIEDAGSKPNTN